MMAIDWKKTLFISHSSQKRVLQTTYTMQYQSLNRHTLHNKSTNVLYEQTNHLFLNRAIDFPILAN